MFSAACLIWTVGGTVLAISLMRGGEINKRIERELYGHELGSGD